MTQAFRGSVLAVAASTVLALAACSAQSAPGTVRGPITSIGTETGLDALSAWIKGWTHDNRSVSYQYSPDGQSVGIDALSRGQAQVAMTDRPVTEQESRNATACGPDGAFSIPAVVTPIAIAYNDPAVKNLTLDAESLGAIMQGRIAYWDDPTLLALNPAVKLPHKKIAPILADEPSALTKTVNAFIHGQNSAKDVWDKEGKEVHVNKYNDSASKLDETEGGITVLPRSAAFGRFDVAAIVVNGSHTTFDESSLAASAENGTTAPGPGGGVTFTPVTADGRGYPILATTYMTFCRHYDNESIATLVRSWGNYILKAGQQQSNYFARTVSPTPEALTEATEAIQRIDGGTK